MVMRKIIIRIKSNHETFIVNINLHYQPTISQAIYVPVKWTVKYGIFTIISRLYNIEAGNICLFFLTFQTDIQTEKQRFRQSYRHIDIKTDIHTDRFTERHADRHTDIQTNRHIDK